MGLHLDPPRPPQKGAATPVFWAMTPEVHYWLFRLVGFEGNRFHQWTHDFCQFFQWTKRQVEGMTAVRLWRGCKSSSWSPRAAPCSCGPWPRCGRTASVSASREVRLPFGENHIIYFPCWFSGESITIESICFRFKKIKTLSRGLKQMED